MNHTFEEIRDSVLDTLCLHRLAFKRSIKSHSRAIVNAKQMICYVAVELGYSKSYIAEQLGVTEPAVRYHYNKAQDYLSYEKGYADSIEKIFNKLGLPRKKNYAKGWIVRETNEDGAYLYFSTDAKPERDETHNLWSFEKSDFVGNIPKEMFPQITFECEPIECEIQITLKYE